jgi:hypothetical protein
VSIEYRAAEGVVERLPELAAEFVGRQLAVIVATGGAATAVAAKKVAQKIPIVFTTGRNPVEVGLVAALHRPGGPRGLKFGTTEVWGATVEDCGRGLMPGRHEADSVLVRRLGRAPLGRRSRWAGLR